MKINKISVTTTNLPQTISFYSSLGLKFPKPKKDEQHIESIPQPGEPALMIDTVELTEEITGAKPIPGTHSVFAIEYDSSEEVDQIIEKLKKEGFKIEKEPWKAFWGQYYAIVMDPEGYKVDLYVNL